MPVAPWGASGKSRAGETFSECQDVRTTAQRADHTQGALRGKSGVKKSMNIYVGNLAYNATED
ncbi:MAG TPA: hypothetical protein PKG67_10075, partial [Turneriella sp.]|nr:hypothetical protein [Turneriella sp.]